MKINIKGFITSKKSELYSDCADNYAFSDEHNKFAISDGVSKSFFPKAWSEILVCKYVNQKKWKDNNEFIAESQKEWQSKIDEIVNQPETKWFTKSQYNRKDPALATFVGLEFLESDQKWIAQALGDSFLFFIPKDSTDIEIKLSTKPEPIVFDNFPDYLSSIGNYHKGEKKPVRGEKIKEGIFYLMTDALAEWFLSNTEQAKQKLDNIQNQEQFLITVEDERNANRLNDDDSAVLILELIDDGKNEFSYSNIEVTLLSELIKEEAGKLEGVKKKEISSQDSLIVNEDESKEEEQLTKEEKSKNEIIDKNEKSTEIKDVENENSKDKIEDEKPFDKNESLKENTAEYNLPVKIDNLPEQSQEKEEKSSEPIQNIIPDNPKTKSIFDKF